MGLPTQTTRPELIRKFKALGWEGPFSGGKHPFMRKGKHKVHVPNPHGSATIGPALLRKILGQAGIAVGEWTQA
jgi:predicted RNA binding protein YcfA (HicA-like mRNA interferase family)